MPSKNRAFTIIELLISVVILVLAVIIALQASLGTSSVVKRVQVRTDLSDGQRNVIDNLRLTASVPLTDGVSVKSTVSYADPDDDTSLSLTPTADNQPGFAVEVRRFAQDANENICYLIGRMRVMRGEDGQEKFFLGATTAEDRVGLLVAPLNAAGSCEYTNLIYRGTLTPDTVQVTEFSLVLRKSSCLVGSCEIGQLRYHLTQVAKTVTKTNNDKTVPSLDVLGGLFLGLR